MTLRHNINSWMAWGCLTAALAGVPAKADTATRVPIDRDQIISALSQQGVRVAAPQVDLLCELTATQSQPRLQVVSVSRLDGQTSKVRMQCERNDICLPFYFLLHWTDPTEGDAASTTWTAQGQRSRRHLSRDEIMVRSGRRAILVFEGSNYRIRIPVLCMESGAKGQAIRVMSTDRKKTYVARVVSPRLLQGTL